MFSWDKISKPVKSAIYVIAIGLLMIVISKGLLWQAPPPAPQFPKLGTYGQFVLGFGVGLLIIFWVKSFNKPRRKDRLKRPMSNTVEEFRKVHW